MVQIVYIVALHAIVIYFTKDTTSYNAEICYASYLVPTDEEFEYPICQVTLTFDKHDNVVAQESVMIRQPYYPESMLDGNMSCEDAHYSQQ